ncbi:hypothetical protein LTR37_018752 [Vermiconidia calcicola]|uniref:Uncharacterized protein n=1 Tax=Vermiconidia calcicola TaxID=1690605 RepID=A0ACC3MG32_9PEZI|nr:hypothetical protein LTR37_018752 [Vermiconidia calcicola]
MSKRTHNYEDTDRPPKRSKSDQSHNLPAIEEIHFARQLQQCLAFRQDGIQQLRNGIASFKAFLESILYHKDEDNRARQLSILREFLNGEKPADIKDTERPFLAQLWQAWSFASQNNNDHLSSSVSAVLALLLKTLSSLLDFRDYGLLLCRTVLQHQHLRLIKKSLDASKHKDFLISPCLRLLIEVTSFDGGVLAREVFKRREQTFDSGTLRRNLGITRPDLTEDEAKRRPAIRTLTIRYILTHLKYLHEGGKVDLLKSRPLCTSLFHFIRDDPAEVVNELLSATEQHILKDVDLPRSAKAALLVQPNLERITDTATRSQQDHAAAEKAFAWLRAVGSNPSYGILRTSGWYPPGTTNMSHDGRRDSMIDVGLDSIEFFDRDDRPNIRNTTLLSWLQTLRPHSSSQERDLALTCFNSAPELVAAYFMEKHMQLEPKLTNTWIGYASFLFEVMRLPVPASLGNAEVLAQLPPQTNIMIENILPRPLSQKVLTRCLNQSSDLITFFAVRLLILALGKLAEVRSQLIKHAASFDAHAGLWHEASERLLALFVERCPSMKDVIAAFRKTPDGDEHALQRGAVTRLLRLFYEVLPLQAMEEQFDVSATLAGALIRNETGQDAGEVTELRKLELESLLQIARHSPGMRWFSKQGSLAFSPIVTLLKQHSRELQNRQFRSVIYHVLVENGVLNSFEGVDALIAALSHVEDHASALGPFLDDCFTRAIKKPIKYLDDLEEVASQLPVKQAASSYAQGLPSNLAAVLLEQAPFVAAKPPVAKQTLMTFINNYVELLMHSVTRPGGLEAIQASIEGIGGFTWERKYADPEGVLSRVRFPDTTAIVSEPGSTMASEEVVITFDPPPFETENHPELFKWAQKDLDMALEDGEIGALFLCLCSQYPEIRTQALIQLHKLEDRLLSSTIEDKNPIYVLLGELIETYEHHCLPKVEALPYLAGCFATHASKVQRDPIHFMYPKINMFLNKGPEWRINKLPTYWIEKTALSQPEEDDAYWKEVQWVLRWIDDGLRTVADLEIIRKASVFEKVMALCFSPGAASHKHVKERVLELIWRATFIEGGSNTLITRTGVLSWLDMVQEGPKNLEGAVKKRIIDTCDQARIKEWSGLDLGAL